MHSVLGMLAIVAFAYAVSSNRQAVAWRTIGMAFGIQFIVGGIALFTSWGNRALSAAADVIGSLLSYSRAGIDFMFGQLAAYDGPIGFVFAVNVLPVVVFSAFIAVLYHLGVMMWVVRILVPDCAASSVPVMPGVILRPIFSWVRRKLHAVVPSSPQ